MKLWWYNNPPNYGDILTPHIMAHYGFRFDYSERNKADALCVGSIARWARPGMMVLGSGFIDTNDPVCRDADYRFVRGPMTRAKILESGGECPEIYGDMALLLPEIWPESEKKHDLGIIPHYVDAEIARKLRPNLPIIDLLTTNPKATTEEITSCRTVISSSLHGIIVAHAYGIPAAWVKFSDKLVGDDFKFMDYYASVGLDAVLSTIDEPVFSCPVIDTTKMREALLCCR